MIAWNLTSLKVLPGHRLEVGFADGLQGVVDMSAADFRGVLGPLADEAYFARAALRDGVVVWPNGADIAPDALYDEVNQRQPGMAVPRPPAGRNPDVPDTVGVLDGPDQEAVPLTPDVLVQMSKDLRKRPELFRDSLTTVPVIEREGRAFAVRLADIPEPHRTAFAVVLRGSQVPVLDGEGDLAYAWDFADWVRGTSRWL